MLKKIWEWTSRTVYWLWKNHVLKLAKINYNDLYTYIKEYFSMKDPFLFEFIFDQTTWINSNLYEYKNSKISNKVGEIKYCIFWIINIQKKYELAFTKYKLKKIDYDKINDIIYNLFPELDIIMEKKEILEQKRNKGEKIKEIDKLTKEERFLSIQYKNIFHFIDNISDYWINNEWNIILLDWWNKLIWKLLKEKGEEILNILFDKK